MKYNFTLLLVIILLVTKSFAQIVGKRILTAPVASKDTTIIDIGFVARSEYTISDASGSFTIDIDQDFFLDWYPKKINFDRNYSQGTAFSYSKYGLEKSILFSPMNLLGKILPDKFEKENIVKFPSTISMGVTAFTPLDIADSLNPVIGDRPFANVVFLTTAKNRYNDETKMFTTTSFSYGIIGSNIGNAFQSKAHTVITGRPTNIGWQYQISRGGHPAFLFSHSALRSIINLKLPLGDTVSDFQSNNVITKESADDAAKKAAMLNRKSWLQASLGYKINLGWYTGIAAIATIKIGGFTKFSNIFGTNNALGSANAAPQFGDSPGANGHIARSLPGKEFLPKWRFDWYFYGTGSPRLTPYNSLLLGQPGVTSVYTLPKENYNPFVLDFEVGLFMSALKTVPDVLIPLKNIDLILSINGRTSEIISKDPTQPNEFQRTHYWGRVTLRFPLF